MRIKSCRGLVQAEDGLSRSPAARAEVGYLRENRDEMKQPIFESHIVEMG